jgi:hypothetical protein
MDIIQVVANLAQIGGVLWMFFYGGKAVNVVVKGIMRKHPRLPSAGTITNILLASIFLVLVTSLLHPTILPLPWSSIPKSHNATNISPTISSPTATSTPTTIPTATPKPVYPPPNAKLILNDPLSQSDEWWQNYNSSTSDCNFKNGA